MIYTPPCDEHSCSCFGPREAVVRPDEFERWLASPLGLTLEEWYDALPRVFATRVCTCDGRHHQYCRHHWHRHEKYISTGTSSKSGQCIQMWPEDQGALFKFLSKNRVVHM
jgi:hypothetical protein